MSHTHYETDVVAWANEQAALLRSGKLSEIDWLDVVWSKAVALATAETGLDVYPENGIWETQQILSQTFYPD